MMWTLEAAIRSGVFSEIVISSDDVGILELARREGVRADPRPPELAGDTVRFIEVLVEFLSREEETFDAAAVLLPTCPFRLPSDLHAARRLFEENPENAIISVNAYEFPPDFACDLDEPSGRLTLREPEVYARSTQSQSVRAAFHPNGSIYWTSVERILRTGSFFDGPLTGLPIPPERSMDLDYPHQWPLAEVLAVHLLQS
jgi:N-acylneuraminate cytidylyltransferase